MAGDASTVAPAPRPKRRLLLVVIERVLLLVGLSALGYTAGTIGGAAVYQEYESRQLDAVLQSGPQTPGADGAQSPVRRSVVGRIDIPRLGVSTIIKAGDDARTLQLAVGHIRGTAWPGAPGNIGLAGHRDTFFRRLQDIEAGDVIQLVAPEGTFNYEVERTHVVGPKDVWVLDDTGEPTLTLVTCYPFTYVGTAPERFIVRARLVTEPAAPDAVVRKATHAAPANETVNDGERRREKPAPRRVPTQVKELPGEAPSTQVEPERPAAAKPPAPVDWWHTRVRAH